MGLHKHLERMSQYLWNFSFFLGKLRERDSEAIFAFQPEGRLFALALREWKEVSGEQEKSSLPGSLAGEAAGPISFREICLYI